MEPNNIAVLSYSNFVLRRREYVLPKMGGKPTAVWARE